MSFKVLVSIPWFKSRDIPHIERLTQAGCEVVVNGLEHTYDAEELSRAIPGVDATIAGSEPYNEQTLAAADRLKVIARVGVGYDQIDLAAATKQKVQVAMAFGTNHEAVADHAFALMAALANNLLPYHRKVMDGGWGGAFHASLWRATTGIVGLGRIGRALARRCKGFEMRVLAADTLPDRDYCAAEGIELVDFETLLKDSDFVSINAPHAPESDRLINREALSLMKPTAYLVNTARGGLVDQQALLEALQSGRIAGAGLDVFEIEPLPEGDPLRELDNVLFTPHCAGSPEKALGMMLERCIESVLAVKEGKSPGAPYLLNPEALA
jgi:D-3-phosphoglycerate dehydrogenase